MSVPGAFFEIAGSMHELDRIMEGIERNSGRETSDQSMTLDLWLEMKEEWFRLHDDRVRSEARKTAWLEVEVVVWKDRYNGEVRREGRKLIEVVTAAEGEILFQDVESGTHRMIPIKDLVEVYVPPSGGGY